MVKLYVYKSCDTCRKAKRWMDEQGFSYDEIAIRETPPTKVELRRALRSQDLPLKALFNVSGRDYRSLGLKDRLPELSEDECLDLLMSNGNLVKRPFLVTVSAAVPGFKPDLWSGLLGD